MTRVGELWSPPRRPGDFGSRGVNRLFGRMLHNAQPLRHAGGNDGASDYSTVSVPALNPIIIRNACVGGINVTHPHNGTASGEGQHSFVVIIAGVDTPLLVSRHKVKNDGFVSVVRNIFVAG